MSFIDTFIHRPEEPKEIDPAARYRESTLANRKSSGSDYYKNLGDTSRRALGNFKKARDPKGELAKLDTMVMDGLITTEDLGMTPKEWKMFCSKNEYKTFAERQGENLKILLKEVKKVDGKSLEVGFQFILDLLEETDRMLSCGRITLEDIGLIPEEWEKTCTDYEFKSRYINFCVPEMFTKSKLTKKIKITEGYDVEVTISGGVNDYGVDRVIIDVWVVDSYTKERFIVGPFPISAPFIRGGEGDKWRIFDELKGDIIREAELLVETRDLVRRTLQ